MTRKEYNGWTNYETWVVKLWMDNDQGNYLYFKESAEYILEQELPDAWGEDGRPQGDMVRKLAAIVQEQHEESLPKLEGFAADLMNAALSEVNWEEIAYSLLEDAKEALEA